MVCEGCVHKETTTVEAVLRCTDCSRAYPEWEQGYHFGVDYYEKRLDVRQYRCKETWYIPKCDDNGFTLENEYEAIKDDSVWLEDTDEWRLVGGEVRLLDKSNTCSWIEISKETLDEYFDLIK